MTTTDAAGSTGQEKHISSIRKANGSNTEKILELGRKLADHLQDYDIAGHWMAHHLAELIVAAQDDAATTVEQRVRILDTILKIWEHRHSYPNGSPLDEFENVFAALDRLGGNRPWATSYFNPNAQLPGASVAGIPLVSTATELDSLARDTLLRLIWLAAENAEEATAEWLVLADEVASNIESEVTGRLRSKAAWRRQQAEGIGPESSEAFSVTQEPDDWVENAKDRPADHHRANNSENDPLHNVNHAKRLREMADLLNRIANALAASEPQ